MADYNALSASQLDITAVDRRELIDLKDVKIEANLPASDRMQCYLEQIKNPYCFLCGGIPVKVSFSSDGDELAELLKKYFITLKCNSSQGTEWRSHDAEDRR